MTPEINTPCFRFPKRKIRKGPVVSPYFGVEHLHLWPFNHPNLGCIEALLKKGDSWKNQHEATLSAQWWSVFFLRKRCCKYLSLKVYIPRVSVQSFRAFRMGSRNLCAGAGRKNSLISWDISMRHYFRIGISIASLAFLGCVHFDICDKIYKSN